MAARALRAARRPLSLLAACGFLMSTLALGLYKKDCVNQFMQQYDAVYAYVVKTSDILKVIGM